MLQNGVYTTQKIFTGNDWLYNHAIIVQDGYIQTIVPQQKLIVPATKNFGCLIPAFIDAQIYGAFGKLFSQYPTTETLQNIYTYCTNAKTNLFLPTVATNTYQTFFNCIDAVKNYWKNNGKGCIGLHIEGPWISKEKRGAHAEHLIHQPTIEQVTNLLNYGQGVIKMITLAPEVCTTEILQLINSHNIIISAGHSNANYYTATQAFNNGINVATHLYNAMSGLQHRQAGMVGAIFNNNNVMASIIPDGHHVSFEAITIAQKIMQQRLFVITDAVTETTDGQYPHKLVGNKYESNNTLSGSALTMQQAVLNLVQHCNIPLEEAFKMCSLYAAKALKLENEVGKIEEGYRAEIVEWELEDF